MTEPRTFLDGRVTLFADDCRDVLRGIRMSLVMDGPVTRANAGMKARNRPRDDGPLFDMLDSKTLAGLAQMAIDIDSDITVKLVPDDEDE